MCFVVPHQVQESVASCLPPLVPAIKEDAAGIVRNLLQLLLESDKYAERKGAAYGLAGLVKGLGILALKQQDIMTTLTDAIQDKKNFRRREGQLPTHGLILYSFTPVDADIICVRLRHHLISTIC